MLNYILDLAERISGDSSKLSSKEKNLIREEVSFALDQTRDHIATTRKKGHDKSNTVLANAWRRAADNLRGINNSAVQQLVETMDQKGKYWSDPDSYDQSQFDEYTMRINQVESTLNKMCK